MHIQLRHQYVSDDVLCRNCNCEHPVLGCGWVTTGLGNAECSTCSYLEALEQTFDDPGLRLFGCGKPRLHPSDGNVVYLNDPKTVFHLDSRLFPSPASNIL